jgi:zinc transport system permease protein
MLEIFSYNFMLRAFAAGIIIAAIAPAIGTFLVAKRYSLFADTLAHVSLAGIAIALFLNIHPLIGALVTAVLAAVAIEQLRIRKGIAGESALAMFLSGGLALAIVLISLNKTGGVDLLSYLFGSITTVQSSDLWISVILGLLTLGLLLFFYKPLLYISFDEETAKVSGLKTNLLNIVLLGLTAVTVVISIRVVGVLLIGALMVIPVVTASLIAKSFKQSLFLSLCFSISSVIGGLIASYYLNLPAGGAIVLLALLIFGIVALGKEK